MRKRLIDMYLELKESGSTSDFPYLLANTMYKVLIEKFKGVNSPWRQYVERGNLSDFKTADRVLVDEAPDMLEIEEDGGYTDSELGEHRYQISLKTFGRTFSIGRRVIINDDLNAIRKQPARFGRAAARTLAKKIVAALEGDGNTYDGKSMFHDDHANKTTTALANTAAGIAAVAAAMTAIETATDATGEKMGLMAKFILVPPALEDTALRIVNGQQIWPVSTNGGTPATGKAQKLTVLVDPFLTSAAKWYVMADPMDAPFLEVGFLDGKEEPDLLVKKADTIRVAGGGDDPWGFEFDDIVYKVRHDWAIARAMYQGIYRGGA